MPSSSRGAAANCPSGQRRPSLDRRQSAGAEVDRTRRAWLRRLLFVTLLPMSIRMVLAESALKPWPGGPLPPLRLRAIDGREFDLSTCRGRVVVVNFWASWCAPCVAELPALQRLRDDLTAQRVDVVGVNLQENAARIGPFVERLGVTFPIVRDHDGAVRAAWKVSVFPTTFVVGRDQRVALVAEGEVDWDDSAIRSRIRGAL